MINIAIVEDNAEERVQIRKCLSYLEETDSSIRFAVSEFSTGTAFLGNYRPEYDIVLMDIDMPGMDGLETARGLRRMDTAVVLVFVTNMAQFAISGYEVDALDFVLKPINKYSFALKMKRAISRTVRRTDDYISIRSEGKTYSVRISSILYLVMEGHYVVYHTTDGTYSEYTTMKEAYGKINRSVFVFANRSCLVNLQHVDAVNHESVQVDGDELPVSRPQRKTFLTAMANYMGGKG